MKLKTIDLFSGIGGFTLGLDATGHFETIQFVEMDKFCQKILTKNFKGVPIHEDVKTYNPPTADVVVGGFPCQGFSVAGKRAGTKDDRYLWPEMLRVVREAKPRWVIGENVRGIINIEGGMVFKQVHTDLEEEGFQVKCFVLPATSVNAPHQRYRTFFIGHSMENARRTLRQRGIEQEENEKETEGGIASEPERSGSTRRLDVADTECNSSVGPVREIQESKAEDEEQIRQDYSSSRKSSRASSVRLSDKGSEEQRVISNTDTGHLTQEEEIQARWDTIKYEGWWGLEPNVGRVAYGVPSRAHRLRSLGNAVVPQLIYQIGKSIVVAEGLDKK